MGSAMRKVEQSYMLAIAEKGILGSVKEVSLKRWYVK